MFLKYIYSYTEKETKILVVELRTIILLFLFLQEVFGRSSQVLSHAKQQKIADQNRQREITREETTKRIQQV